MVGYLFRKILRKMKIPLTFMSIIFMLRLSGLRLNSMLSLTNYRYSQLLFPDDNYLFLRRIPLWRENWNKGPEHAFVCKKCLTMSIFPPRNMYWIALLRQLTRYCILLRQIKPCKKKLDILLQEINFTLPCLCFQFILLLEQFNCFLQLACVLKHLTCS